LFSARPSLSLRKVPVVSLELEVLCNTVLKPLGIFLSREFESCCARRLDLEPEVLDLREGAEKRQRDNALGLERAKGEAL